MRVNIVINRVDINRPKLDMNTLEIIAQRRGINSQIVNSRKNDSDDLKNILKTLG